MSDDTLHHIIRWNVLFTVQHPGPLSSAKIGSPHFSVR